MKRFFIIFAIIGLNLAFKATADFNISNLKDKKNLIYFAVLGSGPAGLSAGIYGARAGFVTGIFQGPKPGGQLHDSILVENWPGVERAPGAQVIEKLQNQAKSFGANLIPDTIEKIDFNSWPYKLYGQNDTYYAMTLIIATGATPRKLNLKGESEYWLKGILACGLCDASLAKGQHVVIIGGGDSAMERILQVIPYAKSVDVIVRSEELRAAKALAKKVKDFSNVKIIYNTKVLEFLGDGKKLNALKVMDQKDKHIFTIETPLAFVAAGFRPNTKLFQGVLPLTKHGYVVHDKFSQETKKPGVFVAGNAADYRYKQASTASGDATKAAINAIKFLYKLPINKADKIAIKNNLLQPAKETEINTIETENDFNNIIRAIDKPAVVVFYSPLCSSCKLLESLLSTIVSDYASKISFYKIERAKFENISNKFNVPVVPEILIFKNNKVIKRLNGEIGKKQLTETLESIDK